MIPSNNWGDAPPFELALQRHADQKIVLRLYVLGASYRSGEVIARVKDICGRYLAGRCDLEVIDIYQQPELARADQVVATPTLLKATPSPRRWMVGDMSHLNAVLHALGVAA